MLPVIFAAGALIGGGIAVYKYVTSSSDSKDAPPRPVSLGRFAVWGRPNVGKTTFVSRLLDKPVALGRKEATTSRTIYTDIPTVRVDGQVFQIDEISDMPGTQDRINDWLKLVSSHDHVFYLVDLSRRADPSYAAQIRADLSSTVKALETSSKESKRLHIIASHVDMTEMKDVDPAEINNVLQNKADFRKLHESIAGVAGYVYAANLTDDASFNRLLQSIIEDCRA